MSEHLPMIALAVVLLAVVASLGFWVLKNWKTSRAPSDQKPPEVPTRQWLDREAANARNKQRAEHQFNH